MSSKPTDQSGIETQNSADPQLAPELGRRAFIIGAGASVASVGMMGSAVASNNALNWSSDLAPDLRIEGSSVVVAETTAEMSELDFTNNDGEVESLMDYGAVLRRVAPSGNEDDPNNPVEIRADQIDAETFTAYPRDVTDSNDDPVSALDATNWSTSGATVSDAGDSLSFSASAGGDTATLDLSAIEGVIDSGIERHVIHTVASITSVGTGVDITLRDGSGNSVTETIGAQVADGIVTQTAIGELTDSGLLEQISEVELVAVGGAAEMELIGLDLEREGKLLYGRQQATETNDDGEQELVTNDLYEPVGYTAITSISSIASDLNELLGDVRYHVDVIAEEISSDNIASQFTDAPASRSASRQLDLTIELEIPTAFDLEWSMGTVMDTGSFPSGNYRMVEILDGEELEDLDETYDLGDSATEITGDYSLDTDVDPIALNPAPSQSSLISYSILMSEDQESMLKAGSGDTSFFGGAGGSSGGGGLLGSLRGFVLMIAGVGGAVIAALRARGRSLGIGGD
jgi:hypothetical protein